MNIQMNDLKIITFCTFVILFTIGNLLILLFYKPRSINDHRIKKVKLLLAFNILSFLLMKVYCKHEMKRTESSPLESFQVGISGCTSYPSDKLATDQKDSIIKTPKSADNK